MYRLTQSASVQICSATPNSGSQRQLFPSERLARTPLTVHGGHGFKGLLSRNYPDFVTPQHFLAITSRTALKGALSHSNHGLGVRGFSSRLSSACAATTSILLLIKPLLYDCTHRCAKRAVSPVGGPPVYANPYRWPVAHAAQPSAYKSAGQAR